MYTLIHVFQLIIILCPVTTKPTWIKYMYVLLPPTKLAKPSKCSPTLKDARQLDRLNKSMAQNYHCLKRRYAATNSYIASVPGSPFSFLSSLLDVINKRKDEIRQKMPPKWGERSGMNFQTIRLDEQNLETRPWTRCWSRKSENSFNSRSAPTKLVPWSLQIIDGWPLREVKRLRAAMNDSAVRSEINSKWTALIVMDTNTLT